MAVNRKTEEKRGTNKGARLRRMHTLESKEETERENGYRKGKGMVDEEDDEMVTQREEEM